jgi:hypothetical protein
MTTRSMRGYAIALHPEYAGSLCSGGRYLGHADIQGCVLYTIHRVSRSTRGRVVSMKPNPFHRFYVRLRPNFFLHFFLLRILRDKKLIS